MDLKSLKRLENLERKFQLKTADEKHPTWLSGTLTFILHFLSFFASAVALFFLDGSLAEKVIYGLFISVLLAAIEYGKSNYMNDWFSLDLYYSDTSNSEASRKIAFSDGRVAVRVLIVFWTLSLAATIYASIYVASHKIYQTIPYDKILEERVESAKNTLKTMTGRVKLAEQEKYQQSYDTAFKRWEKHKSEVDGSNSGNGFLYGFLGFLMALAIELGIYFARQWHEKMQYEVVSALRKKQMPRPQGGETRPLPMPHLPQQTSPPNTRRAL
jgi:hypothetical protein